MIIHLSRVKNTFLNTSLTWLTDQLPIKLPIGPTDYFLCKLSKTLDTSKYPPPIKVLSVFITYRNPYSIPIVFVGTGTSYSTSSTSFYECVQNFLRQRLQTNVPHHLILSMIFGFLPRKKECI